MSENAEKQQLELVVADDFLSQIPAEIPCNIDAVISTLDSEVLPKYLSRKYSNDQLAEARADHAVLKKWVDAVDSTRKTYEKMYMKPFKEFKEKLKLATDRVQAALDKVSAQITEIEDESKRRNEQFCRNYFAETIGDLAEVVDYNTIADVKLYNLSVKDVARKKAIDEKLDKIRTDLAVIDALDVDDKQSVKVFYLRTFNLSRAIAEAADIKRERERISALERAQGGKSADNNESQSNDQPKANAAYTANDEVVFTIRFEVDGTAKDFELLKAFLNEHHIEYRAI